MSSSSSTKKRKVDAVDGWEIYFLRQVKKDKKRPRICLELLSAV
jgi:hypothetical protein